MLEKMYGYAEPEVKVQIIPLSQLEGFDPNDFNLSPCYWGWRDHLVSYGAEELIKAAKANAAAYDEICVVMKPDKKRELIVANYTDGAPTFFLVNAAECTETEATVCGVIHYPNQNTQNVWIKYNKGSYI